MNYDSDMSGFRTRLQYEKCSLINRMFDYMNSLIEQLNEKVKKKYSELDEEQCDKLNATINEYNKLINEMD